jgi:hypothetical protein
MKQRLLYMCGMLAPLWFVFMTILGGALRPGYSHLSDTISELFSPGSPNKLFLDILHTIFTLLLIMFGIGMLHFFRATNASARTGSIGAWLFTAMGCVSVTTAAIFPQDAWGSTPTFAGEMHIRMSGVVGLLSVFAMLFIGIWFIRSKSSPGFGIYSFITIGVVILSTGFYAANIGSPIMGLTERISALLGFQWTFSLALWMFSRKGT